METMNFKNLVLEQSLVYRLWQAPFADQKFMPIHAHNDLNRVRRVLDVGCGPGTSSKYFAHTEYLGIDINERYVETARRRYRLNFKVVDAREFHAAPEDRFDFILVNSFLHHLCTKDVVALLSHIRDLLTEDGCVHILEPELPPAGSIAYILARADRGKFVRRFEEWKSIFTGLFHPMVFQPYPLKGAGLTLWNMLYFKGRVSEPDDPAIEMVD